MMSGLLIGAVVWGLSGFLAYCFVRRYATKTEPAEGLGLFRILYGVILFCEVAQTFFANAVYPYDIPPLFLCGWLIVIACLTVGFYTRVAAILNYALTLVAVHYTPLLYHADYVYLMVNLILTVAPVSQRLSVDAKLWPDLMHGEVSQFWSRVIVLCGIGFIYAEAILWKWMDPMWTSGLGLWKPASVPHAIWCDLSFLLNQRPLVIFLGYLTLYFETAFVILIWFPRLRLPLCVIGIGLHLGTAIVFPLPWFGLVMCALFIPLLPRWVLAIVFRNRRGENAAAATAEGTGVAGGWRRTALMGGVTLLVAAQLTLMLGHPLVRSLAEKTQRLEAWQSFHDHCYLETVKWSQPLAGITHHGVFASVLFERKNWLVSVVYRDPDGRDVPLPFCRENGLAHPLNSGRVWVHWVFYDGPFIGFGKSFNQLIEKMAAHWSARNEWDSNTAKYVIRVKRVDEAPDHWERDFLRRQLDRPWIEVGMARWENGQFRCSIQLPGHTELSKLETTR